MLAVKLSAEEDRWRVQMASLDIQESLKGLQKLASWISGSTAFSLDI